VVNDGNSTVNPNVDSSRLFINSVAAYDSVRLHDELIRELKTQQTAWENLLRRRRAFATYDEVDPPGRTHCYPRRTEDAEPDEASDIYGVLYQGFTGLAGFRDRSDLPFIRGLLFGAFTPPAFSSSGKPRLSAHRAG
jgi:hypothetical protein